MKRRVVRYALTAADDFDWIYDVIAGASTPLTAARYEQRLRDYCDGLDYASECGTRRDDVRPGLRIVGFERRVTVAFTVEEDTVTILRLFYGGADWERDL